VGWVADVIQLGEEFKKKFVGKTFKKKNIK
jgi:hypothetical protein